MMPLGSSIPFSTAQPLTPGPQSGGGASARVAAAPMVGMPTTPGYFSGAQYPFYGNPWAAPPATLPQVSGAVSHQPYQQPPIVVRRLSSGLTAQSSATCVAEMGQQVYRQPLPPTLAASAKEPMTPSAVIPSAVSTDTTQPHVAPAQVQPIEPAIVVTAEAELAQDQKDFAAERCEQMATEMAALRRALVMREEHITQLSREVQVLREGDGRVATDLDIARNEIARLTDELRVERTMRIQAEASLAAQQREAAQHVQHLPPQMPLTPPGNRHATQGGSATLAAGGGHEKPNISNSRSNSARRMRPVGKDSGSPERSMPSTGSTRRSPQAATRQVSAMKDEIDTRLREFLEMKECPLEFRRLNRGWYKFRHVDDQGGAASERSVEIIIVNGKLMARLEPTTHDAGWNNGKAGPIDRFVTNFS